MEGLHEIVHENVRVAQGGLGDIVSGARSRFRQRLGWRRRSREFVEGLLGGERLPRFVARGLIMPGRDLLQAVRREVGLVDIPVDKVAYRLGQCTEGGWRFRPSHGKGQRDGYEWRLTRFAG